MFLKFNIFNIAYVYLSNQKEISLKAIHMAIHGKTIILK